MVQRSGDARRGPRAGRRRPTRPGRAAAGAGRGRAADPRAADRHPARLQDRPHRAGRLGRPRCWPAGRMRVLVTGAAACSAPRRPGALAARGDAVTVLQRRPAGLGLPEVLGRRRRPTEPSGPRSRGHDAVVHLAAKVEVTGSLAGTTTAPTSSGTGGGHRRLPSRRREPARPRLVAVGGPRRPLPGRRRSRTRRPGPGARGVRAEQGRRPNAWLWPRTATGLAVVAIRPHLVWGPGDAQLVERVVARARAGRLVLVGSGAALIDTTYVDNAADALVAALDRAARDRRAGPRGDQRRAAADRRAVRADLRGGRSARPAPPGADRPWRTRPAV